ncbi:MAG TPA: diaminopimelate epimerase, partial [Chthoniobacterales bacterium]|nr:diaminopimelate epimerase [Chthoniobacterales bacterium]
MGGGLQLDLGKVRNGIFAAAGHFPDLLEDQPIVIGGRRAVRQEQRPDKSDNGFQRPYCGGRLCGLQIPGGKIARTADIDWPMTHAMVDSMLRFTKMNGAGNDFVMIDNRSGEVRLKPEQIVRICDRHRGVGADGILLLEKSSNGADFRMRYYNRDGGEAEMCGNGARCFARFANKIAGAPANISFETPAGV